MLPSLYQLLLEFADRKDLTGLRTVMVAGEACPTALVRRHFNALPATELVNEYGPTEGTVWSTAHRFQPEDANGKVPIGRPVHGMGHYVLDAGRQPVPTGVAGMLYLSGPQLTRGYHNRPDLTAQAFFPNPFSPGERLYKTGDLARYRHDGTIDFLGRADQQVKVRGHRIELTEISSALKGLHGITESVVAAIPHNGELRLVAYCQTGPGGEDGEPAAQLRDLLPAYMIPDQFVYLAELPRLPNGKIDRKNLPPPDWTVSTTATTFAPPQGEDEEQMAALWAATLGREAVGRHDNFFDIGGDSLKSIRIIAGAKKIGFELAPHHLFNHPTVAELVRSLNATPDPAAGAYENIVRLNKGDNLPPLFCLHSGGGHVFFYQPLAGLLATSFSVYALQPTGLSGAEEIPGSIEEMATNYLAAIRGVQPHGPYHLLGTCFSNALGVEIAHQLKAAGEPAGRLIFVDSSPFLPYRDGAKRKSLPRRALDFALRGNYAGLGKRLWRKLLFARQRVANPLENKQERDLRFTVAGLNKIYADYEWRPLDVPIVFIRSSQFAETPQKQFHLDTWNYLAPAGMDLRVVPGTHLGLFAAPEVEGLAATIEQCLAESSAATGH
jgi:thioesterase domain-containing protein/aryl carrier-like protein